MMIWDWSFFPHNSKNVDLIKLVTEFDNYEKTLFKFGFKFLPLNE